MVSGASVRGPSIVGYQAGELIKPMGFGLANNMKMTDASMVGNLFTYHREINKRAAGIFPARGWSKSDLQELFVSLVHGSPIKRALMLKSLSGRRLNSDHHLCELLKC